MIDVFKTLQEERLNAFDRFFKRSRLRLMGQGKGPVAAWFLGPKAENEKLLRELIEEAIEMHCQARRCFHPDDPPAITKSEKRSRRYKRAVKELRKQAEDLFEALQTSAPIWSMRHQGHMLWDQVMPAVVGYFGAMLYNQNNVAAEASPLTTRLEIEVGNDLCRLLGFDLSSEPPPWGHITCDGSVANIEALWAARNAKFFPLALSTALNQVPALAAAKLLEVNCPSGGKARLIDLDNWTLLNLSIDDVVELPQRMKDSFGIDTQTTIDALHPFAVQNIGLIEFNRRYAADLRPPIAIAPATCHYSWPKAGTLLGLGQDNIVRVRVDLQARMNVAGLRERLQAALRDRVPVIAVVAVIGSTEESAVDPLREILRAREDFRARGLNFAIHCDAAWGGYFRAMLPSGVAPRSSSRGQALAKLDVPSLALSRYVTEQLAALQDADSVTIDPHKAGYVPYPAGALCYRNSAMRDLISLKAPVIFHSNSERTVGIYGIEGSKPGAAPAGVYLAHKAIRPTKNGYGKILGQCVWTATRLYCRLVTMEDERFKIVLFQMLPSERNDEGDDAVKEQKAYIREHFVGCDDKKLLRCLRKDEYARNLFAELGPDLLILGYSFNYVDKDGHLNTDPAKLAELNREIFKICSVTEPVPDLSAKALILTNSSFDVANYGREFVEHYCRRLGVVMREDVAIPFLISTTMDPWTTDTPKGDFLEEVERALREAVYCAIDKVERSHKQKTKGRTRHRPA